MEWILLFLQIGRPFVILRGVWFLELFYCYCNRNTCLVCNAYKCILGSDTAFWYLIILGKPGKIKAKGHRLFLTPSFVVSLVVMPTGGVGGGGAAGTCDPAATGCDPGATGWGSGATGGLEATCLRASAASILACNSSLFWEITYKQHLRKQFLVSLSKRFP